VRKVTVDIVLPVLNEERTLERNARILLKALSSQTKYDWSITIADNGSTDGSWEVAHRIAQSELNVRALRLVRPGRGGALRAAWTSSKADIVAYMDIDLSTELKALSPLLDPIAAGAADISIGSRLAAGSEVTRSPLREAISHLYNLIARVALHYPVRDAQCGFKAASRNVVHTIVPDIEDDSWFFDTELLIRAYRKGLRINEVPVRWVEDQDSRVRIAKTAMDDLRGIWRLRRGTGAIRSSAAGEGYIHVAETISRDAEPTNAGLESSSPQTDAT
jgi:glycosyltransferase involved in cell wall biosynthesis